MEGRKENKTRLITDKYNVVLTFELRRYIKWINFLHGHNFVSTGLRKIYAGLFLRMVTVKRFREDLFHENGVLDNEKTILSISLKIFIHSLMKEIFNNCILKSSP